jgi:hypothetical protein
MIWQAQTGLRYRIVGGYEYVPAKGHATLNDNTSVTHDVLDDIYFARPMPVMDNALRQSMLSDLRTWRVSTVVVDMREAGSTQAVALFDVILDRSPVYQDDAAVWYGTN